MKRITILIIPLAIFVVILSGISLSYFSTIFVSDSVQPFEEHYSYPTLLPVRPEITNISPETTNVSPESSMSEANTVLVDSIITLDSNTHVISNFMLPTLQSSFAIPESQTTVSLKEWSVPTSGSLSGIVVDVSGNVFFAETTGNKIGRLVPSTNVITEWTIPTTKMITEWIVPVFSHSNVWKYLPTSGSEPSSITLDASGNVFFAEATGNKIGRLVPSTNVITEWTIPTPNSDPHDVEIDASGNVYFTEQVSNKIGRLVPSTNMITEWTVHTSDSGPYNIALDASGNVYFTEQFSNKIGSLT